MWISSTEEGEQPIVCRGEVNTTDSERVDRE